MARVTLHLTLDLCLGAMNFGTTTDEATAVAVLERFLERGGTFVDTANNYAVWNPGGTGNESEELLGRWFARTGRRDDVVLATKLGARPRPGATSIAQGLGLGAAAIRDQFAGSLRRLGLDSVELLYLHIDDAQADVTETQRALAELRAAGSISATGISNNTRERWDEREAVNAELGEPPFTAIQMRYSYLTPRPDADFGRQLLFDQALLDAAAARGTRALAYSPLLNGSITRPDRALPDSYQHEGTAGQLAALRTVADRHGANANQVVLQWLLDQGIIPVLGVSSLAQLDEAFAALDLSFDDDDRETLTAARR